MDYKERWCEIYEQFVEMNGREPSTQEMQDAWADYCSDIIDCYSEG